MKGNRWKFLQLASKSFLIHRFSALFGPKLPSFRALYLHTTHRYTRTHTHTETCGPKCICSLHNSSFATCRKGSAGSAAWVGGGGCWKWGSGELKSQIRITPQSACQACPHPRPPQPLLLEALLSLPSFIMGFPIAIDVCKLVYRHVRTGEWLRGGYGRNS